MVCAPPTPHLKLTRIPSMERVNVWVLTQREDLARFLETLLSSHGYGVRAFTDGVELVAELAQGEAPSVVLADDPPPGLPRAMVEARVHEVSPATHTLFLRDSDDLEPGDTRKFATGDYTLNPSELLEYLERKAAGDSSEGADPQALGLDPAELARASLLTTVGKFTALLERYEFLNGGNGPLVERYAVEVARELGLPGPRVDAIAAASLLYDIGMMRVRPEIKLKTTPLSDAELATIRQHPRYSAEFCESLQLPWDVRRDVMHHHERYDGNGYPGGLAGRDIPIGARIIAVGDAYFAMISKRANREPMSEEEALAELSRQAGHQFDPEMVELWSTLIQVRFLDEGDRPVMRIALVDDDHELRILLEARLKALHYELVPIAESTNVLQTLVRSAPEAIIVNADLGWVDGYQLLHQTRLEPELGGVPFLFLSIHGEPAEQAHARAAGADDYIIRPCALRELVARVHSAIRRKARLTDQHFVRPLAGAGIRGRLADMALTEICQVLAQGLKTARVVVTDGDGEGDGELYFRGGQLAHAVTGGRTGAEAFYALLRVDQGEFRIEHGVATPDATVTDRLEYLLMEGMRLIDEERREQVESSSTS